MNSKEAFSVVSNKVRNTNRFYEDELKLIQQELDRLEKLEKENQKLKKLNEEYFDGDALRCIKISELQEENDKLKKVCHILLYKKINIDFLRESKDVDEYNKWISNLMNYRGLSPEQYELLKETFEDE